MLLTSPKQLRTEGYYRRQLNQTIVRLFKLKEGNATKNKR